MEFNKEQLAVRVLSKEDIAACVEIYIDAYSKEPWNEKYDYTSVNQYIQKYLNINSFMGFVLFKDGEIIGEILGLIMPTAFGDYYRIEDFCINPKYQNKGVGSKFIELIKEHLKDKELNSIILNTNRKFPSFLFYKKNGFVDLEESATLFLDLAKK